MATPFRKSGSRNYYIEIWGHGRRRTVSLGTDNYGIARALAGRYEHEARTTGLKLPTKSEIAPLVEKFIRHLRTHLRPKSAENDTYRVGEFFGVRPRGDDPNIEHPSPPSRNAKEGRHRGAKLFPFAVRVRDIEQITPSMVTDFLTALTEQRGIGPKTWNEYRGVLRRFFVWAVQTQGISLPGGVNPADAAPARRVPPPTIRFLTLPQIHRQLEALAEHPPFQAMVATCLYAGLRREELLWLTPADVDVPRRVIHVRAKTVEGDFWRPKTNRNRKVRISETLLGHMASYSHPCKSAWFFPSPAGLRWDPDNFSRALRRVNRRFGLDWGCADYRHTFGTQLAMAGRDERTIAELMGNSPAIVRRHYAAWLPEAHPEAVEFDHPGGPVPMGSSRDANLRVEAERRGLRLVAE